jgi:hypothetical protein
MALTTPERGRAPVTGSSAPPERSRIRAAVKVRTYRTDRWWLAPLVQFLGLMAFIVYGTVAAFRNGHYFVFSYLSPFYSPCLTNKCVDHYTPEFLGGWWHFSPAFLILIFPLGFRFTCYYYRKAYYRAFWLSPPACAVPDGHRKYTGESRFPLLIQNIHRYFFYIAGLFAILLTYDLGRSFDLDGHFFIGVGTAVLAINVALISIYTLSCHSCRHIIGGQLKTFSKHPMRYRYWKFVSKLNAHHMLLAWLSLVWIGVADAYIWLVSNGTFTDYHWIS